MNLVTKVNKFTVAIPAFNEEQRIERVIKNYIKYTDDIIIIDKYSTDRTAEICNIYGVSILNYPSGIDEKEQILMINRLAKYDWVFYTTCSEIAPFSLLDIFCAVVESASKFDYRAAVFNRISYTNGIETHNQINYYREFRNGIFTRFINKNYYYPELSRIHFEIPVNATSKQIYIVDPEIFQIHLRNDDLTGIELKHIRYADIDAQSLFDSGRKASYLKLFLRPVYNFLLMYKSNYRNGFTGFLVCSCHALYIYQVELRLFCLKFEYNKENVLKNNELVFKRYLENDKI